MTNCFLKEERERERERKFVRSDSCRHREGERERETKESARDARIFILPISLDPRRSFKRVHAKERPPENLRNAHREMHRERD
jgi:hypothetical protein